MLHRFASGETNFGLLTRVQSELDRLDLMHAAFRMTYEGKLFLAPVTNLNNALDVGTGTGIWAIDLGQSHPDPGMSYQAEIDLCSRRVPRMPGRGHGSQSGPTHLVSYVLPCRMQL
jgi:ubiquinone/menaquinone biosynthesis C-methylase UbiE